METKIAVSIIIFDIEGTTTSIKFVADTLFPFARREVQNFLGQNWDRQEIQIQIRELIQLPQELVGPEIFENRPKLETLSNKNECIHAICQYIFRLMDADKKVTPLKAIQGEIWEKGYKSGELVGMTYPDVQPAFEKLKQIGIPIYIYSSGSCSAQKLLFGHSDQGDLLHYFSGHFDTTSGLKTVSTSYKTICQAISKEPSKVLFVTDVINEAQAASEVGVHACLAVRPGNAELPETAIKQFPIITSFDQFFNSTFPFHFESNQ